MTQNSSSQNRSSKNPSSDDSNQPPEEPTPEFEFADLDLIEPLLKALDEEGYGTPTEIQRSAIPEVLDANDLLALAQTGTGKTAAFSLPILQVLAAERPKSPRPIRALILAPTRELAIQVEASIQAYGRHLSLRSTVILGGVTAGPQIQSLRRGPDIVVATPGRLLDLMSRGDVRLDRVEMLVLDEADRMLDMGFINDVRKIVAAVPKDRQTLFFSATMPPEVDRLAQDLLFEPVRVEVTPSASVSSKIDQRVMFVERTKKHATLVKILRDRETKRTLVFTRTKHRANRVVKQLARDHIEAAAIHSNKTQSSRQKALAYFAKGSIKVLVATDIAARGIDVDGITHVINFDLPDEPENYVHRIGRTARAGALGVAVAFCDAEEPQKLTAIERTTGKRIPIDHDHDHHSDAIEKEYREDRPAPRSKRGGSRSGSSRSSAPRGGPSRSRAGSNRGPARKKRASSSRSSDRSEGDPSARRSSRRGGGGGGGGARRSEGGGAPRRSEGGGTPRRSGGGGTTRRTEGGGTPRRTEGGGTPRRTEGGGTPRRSEGGGTPRRTEGGGTPRRSEGGGGGRAGSQTGKKTSKKRSQRPGRNQRRRDRD